MDAAAGGEAAQTTAAPADSRADRPRAGAARGQPARREGPRREVRIRHRRWREHEPKPDGAAARPMRGPTEHGAREDTAGDEYVATADYS